MKKLYTLLLLMATMHIGYSQLIINEVLYDPSNNALDGDANGDGVYSQDDDSFIELYNSGTSSIDISGYEIWDDTTSGGSNEYTFPTSTTVPAGEVIVVFGGGGTPSGTFGSATVLTAGSGFSFNNSGEVIGIKDANGNWILFFDSDALSNNPNESYTRNPDITGTFTQHSNTTAANLFSPGTTIDGNSFASLAPPPPLVINEVLYDPSNNALDGDANNDGVYSQNDDSFIELFNNSNSSLDLSGYEIWDDTTSGGSLEYTFPAGTNLNGQEAAVVFGGGTPTGSFGNSLVLNAGSGLSFNNSGEVIGIKDANGNWVLFFDSDALDNNPNESYTRNPDVTGSFVLHSITSSNTLFSPGTKIDGSAFSTSTTPPTGFDIRRLKDTSVILLWDAIAGADLYKITLRPSTSPNWTITEFKNITGWTRRAIDGLTPGTKYFWTVNARVNGNWTGPASLENFTTPTMGCDNPTALSVSFIKTDKAMLSWNTTPMAAKYRIRYREVGTSNWILKAAPQSRGIQFLKGLNPGTTYEWKMRSVCSNKFKNGWINGPNFTTAIVVPGNARIKSQSNNSILKDLKLYPNPNQGEFTLELGEEWSNIEIEIKDINGRQIFSQRIGSPQNRLFLNPQIEESGVYFMLVKSNNEQKIMRLVVQK
ncbi:MAG: lamin tail domain-containing protein [Vicingaceae bacterium]